MNIFYEEFPSDLAVNGNSYEVVTDFREWIKWLDMLSDEELTGNEKIYLTRQMFPEGCPEPFEDILAAAVNPDNPAPIITSS